MNREGAMKVTIQCRLAAVLLAASVASCASISSAPPGIEATAEAYAKKGRTNGLVIVAINWGRRWDCGPYQKAQLMSIGFDRIPLENASADKTPDLFFKGLDDRARKQQFLNFAYLVAPGEYALSSYEIEAAYSLSDIDRFASRRSDLIQNDRALGGTFNVQAGEIVYIGHFFIDCRKNPRLWRYYTEDKSAFDFHMKSVKRKYPFLDVGNAKYRLFRTKAFGLDHKLTR